MTEKFNRPAQICARLGVSRSTYYRMIQEGHLPKPIRISARCVGTPESQLQAIIDQKVQAK